MEEVEAAAGEDAVAGLGNTFAVGERVEWVLSDEDVPPGTVGTVVTAGAGACTCTWRIWATTAARGEHKLAPNLTGSIRMIRLG